jgi:hypothetical protein
MWKAQLFGKEPFAAARRYEAAKIFRRAWDTVNGSIRGAMDLDRIPRTSFRGSAPIAYLESAKKLGEAQQLLYALDHHIIVLVLGAGYSFGETAKLIHGKTARSSVKEIGIRLRRALDELAGHWFGQQNQKRSLRAWHSPSSVPTGSKTFEVTPARVAHASQKGIVIS